MGSQVNKSLCLRAELMGNREYKAFGYKIEEILAVCDSCLKFHDGAPCPDKEDHEPCEDFVPVNFSNGCVYINNKWFKSKTII